MTDLAPLPPGAVTATLTDGRVVAAWTPARAGSAPVGRIVDPDGGAAVGLAFPDAPARVTQVAPTADGGFVLVGFREVGGPLGIRDPGYWDGYDQTYAPRRAGETVLQRYDAEGRPLGDAAVVGLGEDTFQLPGTVAPTADGWAVIWDAAYAHPRDAGLTGFDLQDDYDALNTVLQRLDAELRPLGAPEFLPIEGLGLRVADRTVTGVAPLLGGTILLGTDANDLVANALSLFSPYMGAFLRPLDATARPLGDEILLPGTEDYDYQLASSRGQVAALSDGTALAVWDGFGPRFSAVYAPDGTALTERSELSSQPTARRGVLTAETGTGIVSGVAAEDAVWETFDAVFLDRYMARRPEAVRDRPLTAEEIETLAFLDPGGDAVLAMGPYLSSGASLGPTAVFLRGPSTEAIGPRGGAGDDLLRGTDGGDTLDGGAGADAMIGGLGGDVYRVDDARDVVIEDPRLEGRDRLISEVDLDLATVWVEEAVLAEGGAVRLIGNDRTELLIGNGSANRIEGGALGERIEGQGGDDRLLGGGGDDTLAGGAGADTLSGGAGADILNGGPGPDTFRADDGPGMVVVLADPGRGAGTATDATGAVDLLISIGNLEGGSGDDALTGNSADNVLRGGPGDDTLDGGAGGDDLLAGGVGDDTYLISHGGQTIEEGPGGGFDTVRTSIELDLRGVRVERIEVAGDRSLRLWADAAAVEMIGGPAADILIGGGGANVSTGGGGRDAFVFLVSDAPGATTITDFAPGDRLVLEDGLFGLGTAATDVRAPTAAQARVAIASGRFDYDPVTGELRVDADGDAGPEAARLIATLEPGTQIGIEDVLLI